MKYDLIYQRLIQGAKNRIPEGYTESHHIKPRCIGGMDCNSNIVKLTAREHYVAHQLLVKIYPNEPKLVYAAKMMTMNVGGERPNNRIYEWLRKKHAEKISADFKGHKVSDETRSKISRSLVGNVPWNKGKTGVQTNHKKGKTDIEVYGVEKAAMIKNKISKTLVGNVPWNKGKTGTYRWCTNGIDNKQLPNNELLPAGYRYGRIMSWKK